MNCNETNIAPEVLAPAGGPESLQAAVRAGADAVYLGASAFSARANAQNFDGQALKEAVSYCHARGVKVYLQRYLLSASVRSFTSLSCSIVIM